MVVHFAVGKDHDAGGNHLSLERGVEHFEVSSQVIAYTPVERLAEVIVPLRVILLHGGVVHGYELSQLLPRMSVVNLHAVLFSLAYSVAVLAGDVLPDYFG